MEITPSLEEMMTEASAETALCYRLLMGFSGALIGEFGVKTVFEAIELLSHHDSLAVTASMIQHSEQMVEHSAEEVIDAFERAKQNRESS